MEFDAIGPVSYSGIFPELVCIPCRYLRPLLVLLFLVSSGWLLVETMICMTVVTLKFLFSYFVFAFSLFYLRLLVDFDGVMLICTFVGLPMVAGSEWVTSGDGGIVLSGEIAARSLIGDIAGDSILTLCD